MVAFMCKEYSTPVSFASATVPAKNSWSAAASIFVASKTSPSVTGTSRSTRSPPAPTNTICTAPSPEMTVLTSLARKSPASIVATRVRESADHGFIECGWALAKFFTAWGARRSELPSRNTGLTAEPLTAS